MIKNCYDKNETMQLLGNQYSTGPFWGNKEVREQVQQISEARPYSFTLDAASDLFMLGYIHGKRAERARRKKVAADIKKENVLEVINEQLERVSSDILVSEDVETVLMVVRNKIANMPEEDKWIPVEREYPETDKRVLLQVVNKIAIGFINKRGYWFVSAGDGRYTDLYIKPIAWQPLPEPHKPTISLKNSMTMRKFIEGSNR